jgi:hypothetical protein
MLFALDERGEPKMATFFHRRQKSAGAIVRIRGSPSCWPRRQAGTGEAGSTLFLFHSSVCVGINDAFQECTPLLEMVTVAGVRQLLCMRGTVEFASLNCTSLLESALG